MEACPFGAITFNPEKKIAEKCTLCIHRINKNLLPACVHHCPSKALFFGDINEIIANHFQVKYASSLIGCRFL
jgi:Fe-S-cluster-containing dehydrogenase component